MEAFTVDRASKTGRTSRCKECRLRSTQRYYSDNPEKRRENDGNQAVRREQLATTRRPTDGVIDYRPSLPPQRCAKCTIVKSSVEFSINRRTRSGLAFNCKECSSEKNRSRRTYFAQYARKWRRTNLGVARGRQLDLKRLLKDAPCTDCGRTVPLVAMEFDHLEGKRFKISQNGYRSPLSILTEAAKCDVVCVLCHRERTHSRYVYSDSQTAIKKRTLQGRVNDLKRGPCEICSKAFNPWQMDFDHIDPSTKVDKISNLVRGRVAWSRILAEISKCRLLCALCHRLHTEGEL